MAERLAYTEETPNLSTHLIVWVSALINSKSATGHTVTVTATSSKSERKSEPKNDSEHIPDKGFPVNPAFFIPTISEKNRLPLKPQ